MTQYQLFDAVRLREDLSLEEGETAPKGTPGAIVEVLADGQAYLVELFGGWLKLDEQGEYRPALASEPDVFRETIGVETLSAQQLHLVKPAKEMVGVKGHLLSVLDELSEDRLVQVDEFAESLRQNQ
jgi:hypothetical protein